MAASPKNYDEARGSSGPVSRWWRESPVVRSVALVVLSVSVVAIVHGGAIQRNFGEPQWEDAHFFRHEAKHVDSVADAFRHGSFWTGLYRPLSTNLYYHIGRRGFDHDRDVYHAISAVLFLLNVLLAFWVCRSLAGYWFSLAAALLFASRLASAEVPLYTSQMQSLMPVFFALLALKAYLSALERRTSPWLMMVSAFLVLAALLSKESMVTLPFFCVLLALMRRRSGGAGVRSKRQQGLDAALAGLPLLSLLVWWLIAADFLQIADSRHWKYEYGPLAVAGNGVAYLLSFSNVIMWQVDVPGKITWLHKDAVLQWAHDSVVMQVFFLLLVAVCAGFLLAAILRRRWRPPRDLVLAALGFALFVAATAPMLLFENRMLAYYGYFGHFGTSISCVALARLAGVAAWRRVRSGRGPS